MRYFKWIGKVFLLYLILSMPALPVFAADFGGGSGTASDPYLISTKDHLNNVRNKLSAHYKLTSDITFTSSDFYSSGKFYNGGAGWEPIGSGSAFTGTFDGNGHTISGLYQRITTTGKYGGLFGKTSKATIEDLGLLNLDISIAANSHSNVYIGGIVGYMESSSIVRDCYTTGKITGSSSFDADVSAGGIVGYRQNSSTIEDCYNTAKITGSSNSYAGARVYVGGIGGSNYSSTTSGCYNLGEISAKALLTDYADAGGIVGDINSCDISNCYNKGKITGGYVGGIVGYASGSSDYMISDCYNTGIVTGDNNNWSCRAGGISGYGSVAVSGCYNTGSVKANSGANAWSGGIAGSQVDALEMCYNMGDVTARSTGSNTSSSSHNAYAGGIAGSLTNDVSKSYNTGMVTASTIADSEAYVGGISGRTYGENAASPSIINCYNTGAVKEGTSSAAKKSYVGGITGYAANKGTASMYTTISKCYNTGNVMSTATDTYVGAVVGYKGSYTNIQRCYYLDTFDVGIAYGTGQATKYPSADMKKQATFSDWDFTDIWTMSGNSDYLYPELKGLSMVYTKTATSVKVSSLPSKLTYVEGESLDLTGGRIQVSYDNGTYRTITMTTDMVSGFDSSKIGSQTLTVTYEGYRVTFNITVSQKSISSIDVNQIPVKRLYLEGKDLLDLTGGTVFVYYNNGSKEEFELTEDMVTGFDNTVVGKQILTVTMGTFTDTFEIEIVAKTVTSIRVTPPTKMEYLERVDMLDVTGGIVTVYYNNGTQEEIALTTEMVSGFDNAVVGSQTLTVTYGGYTDTYVIEVIKKTAVKIGAISENGIIVSVENDVPALCIVAVYNSNGKMLTCDWSIITANTEEVSIPIDFAVADGGYKVRAFLVNLQMAPICEFDEFILDSV